MKKLTVTLCLTLALLLGIVEKGYAHNGTHELNLEGWLKENLIIKNIATLEITAQCNKRKNYNEVILGKANIEFNEHKNKKNSDNYWWRTSRRDRFSITLWGWTNSFGIQTSDYNVFWHGRPQLERWNTNHFKGSVVTKKLFMDIGRQGKFQFYLEPNPMRCPQCVSVTGEIKITNPAVIVNCFN